MSKYKCNDCEAEFDEPDTYRECVGEFWGTPDYEEFGCCPVCKSDDIEEVTNSEDMGTETAYKKVRAFFESELKKMSEDKNIGETSKKHWRHKPYKCDFGGGKNG